ncbi:hypothetical protein EYC84_007276 [Monilinia fructicola]|uniref:Uncharacterized protein n=1 Tax=Monilinia fructicola TaxID=38448 RepID=A0A5M9KEA5_MONFR|nr:hypothetical protein EYC84_007276 [Monilinia fructicola]
MSLVPQGFWVPKVIHYTIPSVASQVFNSHEVCFIDNVKVKVTTSRFYCLKISIQSHPKFPISSINRCLLIGPAVKTQKEKPTSRFQGYVGQKSNPLMGLRSPNITWFSVGFSIITFTPGSMIDLLRTYTILLHLQTSHLSLINHHKPTTTPPSLLSISPILILSTF